MAVDITEIDNTLYDWIELPSKGYCYSSNSPLRLGKIALYRTTAKDVDAMQSLIGTLHMGGDLTSILDGQMQQQVVNQDIDIKSLCKTDFETIILYNQRNYYGNTASAFFSQKDITIDLASVILYTGLGNGDVNGYFKYTTTSGATLKYKLLTLLEAYDTLINYDNNMYEHINKMLISINDNEITELFVETFPQINFKYFFTHVTCMSPKIICDAVCNNTAQKITYSLF